MNASTVHAIKERRIQSATTTVCVYNTPHLRKMCSVTVFCNLKVFFLLPHHISISIKVYALISSATKTLQWFLLASGFKQHFKQMNSSIYSITYTMISQFSFDLLLSQQCFVFPSIVWLMFNTKNFLQMSYPKIVFIPVFAEISGFFCTWLLDHKAFILFYVHCSNKFSVFI